MLLSLCSHIVVFYLHLRRMQIHSTAYSSLHLFRIILRQFYFSKHSVAFFNSLYGSQMEDIVDLMKDDVGNSLYLYL